MSEGYNEYKSGPGFGPEDDPYDALDADVVNSHRIDPDLQKRAKKAVSEPMEPSELPDPVYISSRPRNPFIRIYRWLRDLRRR